MSLKEDRELAADLLRGDPEAVAQVEAWIGGAFQSYSQTLAAEREDLAQEALLDLMEILTEGSFDERCSLGTFVRTILHHKCIDRLRSLQRRTWVTLEDLDLRSTAPSPHDELARAQTVEIALKVQEMMPESCRELWAMMRQGLRYREMSQRTGLAEGALRARVLRCRRKALEYREQLLKRRTVTKPR